jgi:hypothetical protein
MVLYGHECLNVYKKISRDANVAKHVQNVQPMRAGGPDGFGYTYDAQSVIVGSAPPQIAAILELIVN